MELLVETAIDLVSSLKGCFRLIASLSFPALNESSSEQDEAHLHSFD